MYSIFLYLVKVWPNISLIYKVCFSTKLIGYLKDAIF